MNDWNIYRTRFLVKARQLTAPYSFIDPFGHQHCGQAGDYLVESCNGLRRIAPRELFEDIYVPMGMTGEMPVRMMTARPPMGVRRPSRRATA
jgi:hypothetical protein